MPALAALPALGNFAGGFLADRVQVSSRMLSFALHAAAGIVFAVVGVELMPQALATERMWLIVLLFVAGGGFAVLVDWLMGAVRLRAVAPGRRNRARRPGRGRSTSACRSTCSATES